MNANPDDNSNNCSPGDLVSLELPASYTCGPIKVKAVGEEIADPTNTVTLEATITSNPCPLTATLSLSWAHDASGNQGTLTINASSNRASATLMCAINGNTAFSCGTGTTRKRQTGSTYTVTLTATDGDDTANAEVVLVVPARPALAVTATPTPVPLQVSFEYYSYNADDDRVLVKPVTNKPFVTGETSKCTVYDKAHMAYYERTEPDLVKKWDCRINAITSTSLGGVTLGAGRSPSE